VCGTGGSSQPATVHTFPTATVAISTPIPTPAPEPTSPVTPTPAPAPTGSFESGPEQDLSSVEFLSNLPSSELACLVGSIVGTERTILLGQNSEFADPLTTSEISSILGCLNAASVISLPLDDVAAFMNIPPEQLKLLIKSSQITDVTGSPEPAAEDPMSIFEDLDCQ